MYLGLWISLCWATLCCGRGQEQGHLSSIMKNIHSKRARRKLKAEAGCFNIDGEKVKSGDPYVRYGVNSCEHCKCLDGKAEECFKAKCAVPTCKDHKAIPGKCCAYTCPSGNTQATELAVIISLSVGLFLLLILLLVVIDRNRKKNQRNRMRDQALEQSQNLRQRPLNNRLAGITEDHDDQIEPPPPYTPGRGRYSLRKPHYPSPPLTPNEPPPPYEINSREATQV